MLTPILHQHHMKPLQSNNFHILEALCMSSNCTPRICSLKKSKEKFLHAKERPWIRKEKTHTITSTPTLPKPPVDY